MTSARCCKWSKLVNDRLERGREKCFELWGWMVENKM